MLRFYALYKIKSAQIYYKSRVSLINHLESGTIFISAKAVTITEKPRRPKISAMNGLTIEDIPESLKLDDVENQLIATNLLFMKLKQLSKS